MKQREGSAAWREDIVMLFRCLACAVTFICSFGIAAAGEQTRATIELFTSQGCSSCPLADKLLGELANDHSLVTISLPIDYWDYLGWKDTLADPRNTARQRAYAHSRGDGKVYTPQVVVNGSMHVLGSDRAAIEAAIAKSAGKHGAMSLAPVTIAFDDGQAIVVVPDAAAVPAQGGDANGGAAEVWLWGVAKEVTIAIGRGENKGQEITYHNVIRRSIKLGDWTGKGASWRVPLQQLHRDGVDAAAVLVQSGTTDKPKAVLGAALAAIR
jgi:hypothetical protein